MDEVIQRIAASGAIKQTEELARSYAEQAQRMIGDFADHPLSVICRHCSIISCPKDRHEAIYSNEQGYIRHGCIPVRYERMF